MAKSMLAQWKDFRRSPRLVIAVVFVALMLDLMLMTCLEPILPSVLYDLHMEEIKLNLGLSTSLGFAPDGQAAYLLPSEGDSDAVSTIQAESAIRIEDTTSEAGIILAVKPGTEIVANVFVGFIVDRYGHKTPMVCGCLCNVIATFAFAYVSKFWMLIIARVMQAVGSSLSVVSGFALLACTFRDEKERSLANGIVLGGLSVGIILGFPLGSTFYEFFGRHVPFLILAGLIFMDAALRLLIVTPVDAVTSVPHDYSWALVGWIRLIMDPYIAISLGCSLIVHSGLGVVLATEAAWIIGQLGGQPWQIGVILVISAIFQFGTQYMTGKLSVRFGRWLFCWIGMVLSAASFILYPLCGMVWHVVGPECVFRAGFGMVLAVITPLLVFITDCRHGGGYGAIYGLYVTSYNLGLLIGPVTGGILMNTIGFDWMYRGMGVLMALYSCCSFCIRNLEAKHSTMDTQGNVQNEAVNENGCLLDKDKNLIPKNSQ